MANLVPLPMQSDYGSSDAGGVANDLLAAGASATASATGPRDQQSATSAAHRLDNRRSRRPQGAVATSGTETEPAELMSPFETFTTTHSLPRKGCCLELNSVPNPPPAPSTLRNAEG